MKTRVFKFDDAVAFDFETTSINPNEIGARVFSISLTWLDGYTEVHYGIFEKRLQEFLDSPCIGIAHNLQFEWAFIRKHKFHINPKKVFHDSMIMHQYVNNLSLRHGLDYVCNQYADIADSNRWTVLDEAVHKASKIYGTYDKIPKHLMIPYQKADAERTMLLYRLLWEYVEPKDEYWNEIELVKATAEFTARGIMIHKENTLKLIDWVGKELEEAKKEANIIAGYEVNLSSTPQLRRLLFGKLQLPLKDSVDKDDLELLYNETKHPIIDCIQKVRAYKSGRTTLQHYLEFAINGILHPNIHTNADDTGRESSSQPNMQNVRKEIKAGQKYTVPARQCFTARPGHFLLLKDYSGIEMRLFVQGTGSKRLIKLCEEDFDFHTACATSFYGKRFTDPIEAIKFILTGEKEKKAYWKSVQELGLKKTREDWFVKAQKAIRGRAKNGRFAMAYGAGFETLAGTFGISIDEVEAGVERDRKEFPEFYQFMRTCTDHAKATGYIETFFGRKLRVDHHRPYAATDYCIQGSAAALFKHAQVDVHKKIKELCILLPVHDELVFEAENYYLKYLPDVVKKTKDMMINYPQITVPLNTDTSISKTTWDKKETYESE